MTVRTFLTFHLPIEMGCVAATMEAFGKGYPDAQIEGGGGTMRIKADDDESLTLADRKRIVRERSARVAKASEAKP